MSIRVGTCSWADDSLSALWYPDWAKSAEGRLRYYAERFDTVELNASFYALPTAETAAAWARRTPDGFIFHVKAFAMMTRHPVRAEQLPPDMRELFELRRAWPRIASIARAACRGLRPLPARGRPAARSRTGWVGS